MAVNEKVVYAVKHTTFGGLTFEPGQQMTGRVPDYVLRSAQNGGVASDSHAAAERAKGAEQARRAEVKRLQEQRAEPRKHLHRG